jgi:hypothetical protein
MGWFFGLLCVAMLVAFNVYSVDAIMRLRTDIQIVRKSVAEILARTQDGAAAPKPDAPVGAAGGEVGDDADKY